MKMLLFSLMILTFSSCLAQKSIDLEDYPILKIAHETSLYRNEVDWETIDKEYIRLAKESQDSTEKLVYLLDALGDNHGAFRSAKTFQIVAYHTQKTESTPKDKRAFNSKFINEVINDLEARFEYKILDNGVGYLKLVAIGNQNPMEVDAKVIANGIKDLHLQGVSKWILDLRFNGGGNMNPMLQGLSALLGDGSIGGSSDKAGTELQKLEIRGGNFYDTGNLPIDIEDTSPDLSQNKMAVLLSRYTVSSGELVAVAFKGREHTRFFGEKSQGLTTVTGYDWISEDLIMLISKAYYRDRTGEIYENGVDVDEHIPFKEYPDSRIDEILESAKRWLNK